MFLFRKIVKKVYKKFIIVVTCIMLVFCGSVGKARAFELVSLSICGAVIVGLAALTGVVLTDKNAYDNASDFFNWSVDSYTDFYNTTLDNAKETLTEFCQDVYTFGKASVTKINEMMPWLGEFVNDYILPKFSGDVNDRPIFSVDGLTNIYFANGLYTIPNSSHVVDCSNYPFTFTYLNVNGNSSLARYSFPIEFKGTHYVKITINADRTIINYTTVYTSGSEYDGGVVDEFYVSDNHVKLNSGSFDSIVYNVKDIYINPKCDVRILDNVNGLTYSYSSSLGKWQDLNSGLELDDKVLNNDFLKDIDIAKPFKDVYDSLTNSIDVSNKYILGNDAIWNADGTLADAGTVSIPTDYTNTSVKDWAVSDDYPLVVDKPLDTVVTDDVIDSYPDYVPTVPNLDYTADWTTVFPFCIPFDLFKFLNLLKASPKAPKFEIDVNIWGMKNTIDIDLSPFNPMASICRTGFDILFIVGLIMVTRDKLIKA